MLRTRSWLPLATLTLMAGCAQPIPLAHPPQRLVPPAAMSAFRAHNSTTNVAFFVGMDDYNGKTLPGIKSLHQDLARIGSNGSLKLFLSADSDVKNDGFRTRIEKSQPWQGPGFIQLNELKTGQTPALRNYIQWVGQQNPANSTHLILGSHGGGYRGIMYDYDGNLRGPSESLSLKQTFKALSKGYTGSRIDSVNFDACMMATIEVGEALKGTVKAFAASEDFSFGGSIPWSHILGQVAGRSQAAGSEALLTQMVEDTLRHGSYGPGQGSQTWSAIRLDHDFDALVKKVDRLAQALIQRLKSDPAEIRAVVQQTRLFSIMNAYKDRFGDFYQRDLIEFCQLLLKGSQDPHVQQSAQEVIAGVRTVLIAEAHGPEETMANGLAIYLPQNGNFNGREYSQTAFAQHTRWDEFLAALNQM